MFPSQALKPAQKEFYQNLITSISLSVILGKIAVSKHGNDRMARKI